MEGDYAESYKNACIATTNSDIDNLTSGWEAWYYFEKATKDDNPSFCDNIHSDPYGLKEIWTFVLS